MFLRLFEWVSVVIWVCFCVYLSVFLWLFECVSVAIWVCFCGYLSVFLWLFECVSVAIWGCFCGYFSEFLLMFVRWTLRFKNRKSSLDKSHPSKLRPWHLNSFLDGVARSFNINSLLSKGALGFFAFDSSKWQFIIYHIITWSFCLIISTVFINKNWLTELKLVTRRIYSIGKLYEKINDLKIITIIWMNNNVYECVENTGVLYYKTARCYI